jgi:PelA/Pel-15E family pectate lyase
MHKRVLVAAACFAFMGASALQAKPNDAPSLLNKPDAWFTSEEGRAWIDNILSWQGKGVGGVQGWPKAYNAAYPRPADGSGVEWGGIATIDNGATHSELRLLARAITLEPAGARQERLKEAFNRGLDALFSQQYANGGWPQRFPPGRTDQAAYYPHITFNDDAMVDVLKVLKEIREKTPPFAFVDEGRRSKSGAAFDKGIDCILKCQVVLKGKLTGWCAQHDEVTLKAAPARKFEPAGMSGEEGASIAMLLMQIEHPDERIKKAVKGAAEWFDSAKIVGKRVASVTNAEGARDRQLVDDPNSTIWARFYDLEDGRPIFASGDGVKRYDMREITLERRNGYAWYGGWGAKVLTEYEAWKKRNPD